jgi:UDP:flavonoid glycosyltransferase YjiC (YdhE family)
LNRETTGNGARQPRPSRALVATWASGGNLPPLLASAELLSASGFVVRVLTSGATRAAAAERGFPTVPYPTTPDPVESVPFEAIAAELSGQAAGLEVARDVLDLVRETSADVLVVDCMLPAALAAGEAAGVPTASVVHFPYALARAVMTRRGGAWTTDRASLDDTRRALGLQPTGGNLAAWESPELLLVTLPRWFDEPAKLPRHVVHAGPLGIRKKDPKYRVGEHRVLLSFSTTVMVGQEGVAANACAALELAGADGVLTRGPAVPRSALPAVHGLEILDWADHDDLIPACDVVVTHGGLGTTLRALAHGRPLLLLPLGRDQHFNASRVAQLGAGLTLPADASVTAIASALERLFTRSAYRERAMELAAQIALDEPDVRAAHALRRLVT